MRKLVLGFGGLLLLLVLLAAGGYGFYWYQVKSYLDRLTEELAPVAVLSYGAVYAHPLGEVGADDLQLTLPGDGTRIPIASVRVRSRDPLFFLDPQGRIETGDWPAELSLVVRQAKFDLSSPLFKTLEQQAAQAVEPGQISPDALGCGAVERFDLAALRKMGYSQLPMDMTASLRFEPINRRILLDAGGDVGGMGRSQLGLELTVTGDNLAPAQLMSANPRLRHLELSYQDAGYNVRRNRFCSGEAGVEVAAYREQHNQLMQTWLLAKGVQLPASLWQVYQGMNEPRASLQLTLDPPGGLGAEVMMGVGAPQELFDRLRVGVKLNDTPVALDDVNLATLLVEPQLPAKGAGLASVQPAVPSEPATESATAQEVPAPVAEVVAELLPEMPVDVGSEPAGQPELYPGMSRKAAPPEEKRYRETSLSVLDGMVGLPVRVYTDLGNKMEGRLVAASDSLMRIEARVDRGLIQFPLEYNQVRRVEVYR